MYLLQRAVFGGAGQSRVDLPPPTQRLWSSRTLLKNPIIKITNLFFDLHFSITDDGETAAPLIAFRIEVARNRDDSSFGGIFFRKLARFCKFKGESLRTTGQSILNHATVKTSFQLFVVIARKETLHLDMLSEILARVHDHLVNLAVDHGPAHARNVDVVFLIAAKVLCKQGRKGKQNGKDYFWQPKLLCPESG